MTSPPVLLVMGDIGVERCGVGSSEAALLPPPRTEVRLIDPTAGSLGAFWSTLSANAPGAAGAVIAYPTISQLERVGLVPRLLLLRWVLRDRWVRVHLHEFDRLRRRHRLAVALLTGVLADRVVVSSEREARALATLYGGWAGRGEIVVVPPANGSAAGDHVIGDGPRLGVVGVVGQRRPDKGLVWLLQTLERLDPRFEKLEIVGAGWDEVAWPSRVAGRFAITIHGHVPQRRLAWLITDWELALAPYDEPPHDGRLSLRTPLAHGVPTLTRGPRPAHLRLRAPHLLFDDEVDVGTLRLPAATERSGLAAGVAKLERSIRDELTRALFEP